MGSQKESASSLMKRIFYLVVLKACFHKQLNKKSSYAARQSGFYAWNEQLQEDQTS
jgi:hypothetical protein